MDTFTLPSECPTASFVNLSVDMARKSRVTRDGEDVWFDHYRYDARGVLRDCEGIPQTTHGSVTPLGYVDLDEDAQTVIFSASVACGIAATAWAAVSSRANPAERDVVLYLTLEACPRHSHDELAYTFGVAPHEVDAAQERVRKRMVDPQFTAQYATAQALIHAACAYFPWYRGDGLVPF